MCPKGKKIDDLVLLEGNSREERLKNFLDSFTEEEKAEWDADIDDTVDENGRHSMTFEEYVSHRLDMMESDGFDIQDYSKVGDPGVLFQFYQPPDKLTIEEMAELQDCACDAIAKYNRENNTRYGNVQVLKANSQALCPYRYYITFQAADKKNNEETFQAKVNVSFPELDKVVELVRIKTRPNPVYITRRHKTFSSEGQGSRPASKGSA